MRSEREIVTHVTFSRLGGAGTVAVRLAAMQQRLGWQADLVTLVRTPFPRWAVRHPRIAAAALFDYYVVRRGPQSAFFSLYRRQHATRIARDLAERTGVLHLHWLPGFLWPPAFFAQDLRVRKVIWSAHDFWLATGGCHHPYGCESYREECQDCPQVHSAFHRQVTATLRLKRNGIASCDNLRITAPSDWARSILSKSSVLRRFAIETIPNPVNTSIFAPCAKPIARARSGVAASEFVVGLGAADLRDRGKQIFSTLRILKDWLSLRKSPVRVGVLIFGRGGNPRGWPQNFVFKGASTDPTQLAEWYNAMDVYVSLSRGETMGNTLAEAAACSVPSICLTGSGMTEVVDDGVTGIAIRSPEELPRALDCLVSTPSQTERMGRAARERAIRLFDEGVVARKFLDLYSS